jgi:hypothetical protein
MLRRIVRAGSIDMTVISGLLVQLLMLSVPGYFILQFWLVRSWRGGWRIAALVPLGAVIPAMIFSAFALSQGSNLWPLTVVLLAPFGFFYLLAAWGWRTITD